MTISREEAHEIAHQVVSECRANVDAELLKLHQADRDNAWTEEKATAIANQAAAMAADKIWNDVYISVGKKTLAVVGATVIASIILLKESVRKWLGLE